MATDTPPCIWVLAGTNGAGKSSIGGAMIRRSGGEYFNPDEVAASLMVKDPSLDQVSANGLACRIGVQQLRQALEQRLDYFLETTLGGKTIAALLKTALDAGFEVRIWYVGLQSVQHHLDRVAARVRRRGHDIPEAAIRKRFDDSRRKPHSAPPPPRGAEGLRQHRGGRSIRRATSPAAPGAALPERPGRRAF